MVTMSHEEASMKIGDVMCLCKVRLLCLLQMLRRARCVDTFPRAG